MTTELASGTQVETDRALIEAELQRLLRQKKFSAAAQMSAFLRYIVNQALDGNGDRIKAYTVGVDALGKPESFDAQNDPSVRVLALRLRKCLNASYENDHDLHHVRIVLKVGTYVPEFLKAGHKSSTERRAPSASNTAETGIHIAATSAADAPLGSKHMQIGGQRQPAENSAHYDQPAETPGDREKPESPEVSLRGGSLLISGMLLLIVVGWTVSASRNDSFAQQISNSVPERYFANVSPQAISGEPTTASQDASMLLESVPTLYLPGNENQSQLVKQVTMLLGSNVVQQGNLDVVHVSRIGGAKRLSGFGYWMMIDEIRLDSRPTLVAQLLRQDSGAVVMSKTLTLASAAGGFSKEEIHWIEALAGDISNANGPLFLDHCAQMSVPATAQCLRITDM